MKRSTGRRMCRWKDNFKMDFKEDMDTIHFTRKKVQWLPEKKVVKNEFLEQLSYQFMLQIFRLLDINNQNIAYLWIFLFAIYLKTQGLVLYSLKW